MSDEMKLQDPQQYALWEGRHADALRKTADQRDRAFREAEDARFAKAQDIIITMVKRWRRAGYSLEEALRELCGRHGDCGGYTYTDLVKVAQALHAKPGWMNLRRRGGVA